MAVANPPRHVSVFPSLPPLPQGDWPAQGDWTYDDYLRLPDTPGARYEVIFGVLYMSNTPEIEHQVVSSEVNDVLRAWVREHAAGRVLYAPVAVRLPGYADPVQPDLLYVRGEHRDIIHRQYVEGAPDLVVEVLSPSTWRTDRHVKFDAYEQAGVAEYWVIDPKTRVVEVYTLEPGERGTAYALLGRYQPGEAIESRVLDGLDVDVTVFFPEW